MPDKLSANHFLADPDGGVAPTCGKLLFHYTSARTLRLVLESGNIRLSTLENVNDPRERKDWVARDVVVPEGVVDQAFMAEQNDVAATPNRLLRLGARIACFTEDRSRSPNAENDSLFHRGWARARMWSQYACDHTGVCLVFDSAKLIEAIDRTRPTGDGNVFTYGAVNYVDRSLRLRLAGPFENVASMQEALNKLTSEGRNISDLYLTKNTDWQSEDEFRILVLLWDPWNANSSEPLDLPYGDSLKAVVLGEHFGSMDWLDHCLASQSVMEDDTLRAEWVNGAPILQSYKERSLRIT